ncbi:MAG: dTDP-4-dehydrorhamnose reductase [Prevotella sp.]|nr:dTDP-4-dehydrorhamnose reductase [Prevotella sp.]MCM1075197.1 dTDP-4-dehydrorhamnose reductase [Ruminococcus sp.]
MKRIIVTGAKGQLGDALQLLLSEMLDYEVLYTDADTLDITDAAAVRACFNSFKPDFVINAAAYTAVDKAESEPDICRLINTDAPGILAEACAETGAKLVHVSTDYVFGGNASRPYKETDTPKPGSVYGRTKLAGEEIIRHILPNEHIILRTAWLYSHTGKNFVKTMLTFAANRDEINVVADQWGCPTYAPDLARGIIAAISAKQWQPGTYHFTGTGRTTWYDFAREIFRQAGVNKVRVNAVTTDQYPSPAHRPAYSVLDCSKFQKTFAFEIADWQTSLYQFFHSF